MSEPMTDKRLAELREDCSRIRANDWYGPPTYNDNVTLDCVAEIDRLRAELDRIRQRPVASCTFCGEEILSGDWDSDETACWHIYCPTGAKP